MYTINARVGASQTDGYGRMKLVSALDVIQDCDMFWMESEPEFTRYMNGHNLGMFLMSRQIDIVRLPLFGERLSSATYIFDVRGFLGCRNTALYDESGAPCVLTYGIGAFVDLDSGQITRLPKEVTDGMTIDPKLDMEYLNRRVFPPDVAPVRLRSIPVRKGDIDINRHMNNARYLEAALELLPERAVYDRVRIDYKKAARAGDVLHPALIEGPSGALYLSLDDASGQPFAVMEFSGMG